MERSVSNYNETLTPAGPLQFCDVTLREGEQTAGVAFTPEERVELVRRLDAAGFQQVQLYNTWHGDGIDEKAMELNAQLCALPRRQIMMEVLNFNTSDFARLKTMIDAQAQFKPDIIHASYSLAGGDEAALKKREEQIRATAEYVNEKGLKCNISLLDSTRSDPAILRRMTAAAAAGGAWRVRLADTAGVASPGGIENMCAAAREAIGDRPTALGIHAHDDFGIGAACTLAGIRGGATHIDASVNGLGERAGNASLIEVVLCLEGLYGIETGIDLSQMTELSRFVERISGIRTPDNAPFVGRYVFSDSLAAHILASARNPFAAQGILPESIGGRRLAFFGKNMNDAVIEMVSARARRMVNPKLYGEIYREVCARTTGKKGVVMLEPDFWKVVDEVEARHA
ncbi:MAG: hypothetical protein II965_07080 [Pyramidobacter sp.]|nr:hypothetical protein [Pyramidobacter sp.]